MLSNKKINANAQSCKMRLRCEVNNKDGNGKLRVVRAISLIMAG